MESERKSWRPFFVLWKDSVPHMPEQVGFQIVVIFELHPGNGLAAENGGVCLLVNFVLLPIADKQVVRDHQGKGGIRVLCFQLGNALRGGMAQGVQAGNAVKDGFLLPEQLLTGVANGSALCESLLFLYALGEMIP